MLFIHIINKLENLGKNYLTRIMLKSVKVYVHGMTTWSHDLKTLNITTLFEKITQHEHEL